LVLNQALGLARAALEAGERDPAILRAVIETHLLTSPMARIDYVAIVDPDRLSPLSIVAGQVLIALAVAFGSTRLIDNVCLRNLPV